MPTYAYACTECGHRFDVQQSFSDASLTQCPECQGKLRKLFNTVGIVFKGSGFYRTDSRTPAPSGAPAADGGSKPSADGGAKPSGDGGSKPAETAASSSTSSSPSSGGSGKSTSSAPAA